MGIQRFEADIVIIKKEKIISFLNTSLLGNYLQLFGIVKFLIISSIPVEETVNSSCEINHCV